MPSEVAAPAAPPAATPPVSTTPPAVPTPPSEQKEVNRKIFDLLMTPTDEASLQKTEEKKDAPKPEAKAPDAEKPIRVSKKKAPESAPAADAPPEVPTREALRKKTPPPAPVAAPAVQAPTAAAAPDDSAFESELVEEEQALLQDARDAEKHLPAKYKDHAKKLISFLRENVKRTSDPNFDPEDPEYGKWYNANLPKINPLDLRQIERARVTEDVEKKFEPRIEQERHARWSEGEAPKVAAKAQAARQRLVSTALPDEVLTAFNDRVKNVTDPAERLRIAKEVESEFALEFETADKIIAPATEQIEEFHRLTTVNPATGKALAAVHKDAEIWDGSKWIPNVNATDPTAKKHAYILAMVAELGREFKENGGASRLKEGKWFATRAEWADMEQAVKEGLLPRTELAKWWTFSNEDIIERALGRVKGVIAEAVKTNRAQLERLGYRRQPAAAAPPPAHQRSSPPAPRPTPPPGPGSAPAQTMAQAMAARLNAPTTLT